MHTTLVAARAARPTVDAGPVWVSRSPRRNGPGKAELAGQSSLPFARDDTAWRPIILLLRGELLLLAGLRLARGKRL